MNELDVIKKRIVDFIYHHAKNTAIEEKANKFFSRLTEDKEGEFSKGPLEKKADKQLLCSIGIDLLNYDVPVDHYTKIIDKIDVENFELIARKLFSDCIEEHNLVYRDSKKKVVEAYNIFLCPIKHLHYYIENKKLGIFGSDQELFIRKRRLLDASKNPLKLKPGKLVKAYNLGHFWTTELSSIEKLLERENPVHNLVDELGLSHFNYEDTDYQYFFYVYFKQSGFETFKPNATIIDWSNPLVGFISYHESDSGKTFSISGRSVYGGMPERVFRELELDQQKAENTVIVPVKIAVVPPLTIHYNLLEQEAISRFNSIP